MADFSVLSLLLLPTYIGRYFYVILPSKSQTTKHQSDAIRSLMSVSVSLGSADFFFAAKRAVAVEVGDDVMGVRLM